MRVMVIGASGFLGTHVRRQASAAGGGGGDGGPSELAGSPELRRAAVAGADVRLDSLTDLWEDTRDPTRC